MPAVVIEEKCIGCKQCVFTCPEASTIIFNQEKNIVEINIERCKSCGLCVEVCPTDALVLSLLVG
ncbi:4Fe-4S binding protein [Candidatus Acetothermia bacterium]|nr:4Fe-4S binding protein [Candidatus Acetothermia bacterium]MCI2427906.1 4Fe-4S binding protein [Candidatus Acetothermia bacterium]MCI2428105.1 4Fe-4S binding protein [Candidatus Acetothermia bacterium]